MKVVGGTFAGKIADLAGAEHVGVEHRVFPDGELNFRVLSEDLEDDVVVALRKRPGEGVNDYLVKTYLLTRTLYEAGADLTLVMPYFTYARQDKVFRPGEPLSSRHVARLFDPLIEKFITVTAHTHRRSSLLPLFDHAEAVNVSGVPALAEALPELEGPFVLGPDTESVVWAEELAGLLDARGHGAFDKERDLETGEISIKAKDFDLHGTVVMVDDMVSTGGTTERAAREALARGAEELHITFIHPVLADGALDRLRSLEPASLIAANTLESPVSVADVVPLVVRHL